MSLLTNGPDTVTVKTKVVIGTDRTGSNKLGDGPSQTYTGVSVQPAGLSAFGRAEDNRNGTIANVDFVIMKALNPPWIGGPHSIVIWNGAEYDQDGVVLTFGRGHKTRHQVIKIKARGVGVR